MRAALVAFALVLAGCSGDADPSDEAPGLDGFPVSGVVVDQNIKPIAGARVTLDGSQTNETAGDGGFLFADVAEGAHQLFVEADGYLSQQAVANALAEAAPLRIILSPIPLPSGYNQTFSFDGFFEAGMGMASVVAERLGEEVENGTACSCTFTVEAAETVRAFIVEAVWVDNLERPDTETTYRWHVATAEPPVTISAYDPSPIRVEVNGGAFEPDARTFEVGLRPDAVWPAVQQEFKLAITLFYGQAPPADFGVLS